MIEEEDGLLLLQQRGSFISRNDISVNFRLGKDKLIRLVAPVRGHPHLFYLELQGVADNYLALYSTIVQGDPLLWRARIHKDYVPSKFTYKMLSDNEFIAIYPISDKIVIFRPLTNKKLTFSFQFTSVDIFVSQILVFRQTRRFCIIDWGDKLKLSYYSWIKNRREIRPIGVYYFDPVGRYCRQLDKKSRIGMFNGYFKSAYDGALRFSYVELKKRRKRYICKSETIQVRNHLEVFRRKVQKILAIEDKLSNLFQWQLLSQLTTHEYLIIISNATLFSYQFPLVVDTSQGKDQAFFKELKIKDKNREFQLPVEPSSKITIKDLDLYLLIKIQMQGQLKSQKIMLVDKVTKEIVEYRGKRVDRCQLFALDGIGYAEQCEVYNSQRSVQIYERQFRTKDAYLNCLLHLNKDFDDDMLQDCTELLDEE